MINDSLKMNWRSMVAKYQQADVWRSLWQVANTLIPYFLLWYLMYLSLNVSYWLTLGLSILTAGFMVRTFIIFHDCGHGSFFKSKKANDILGNITGILTFTPYAHWTREHAVHHATAGNLDKRGTGDVLTLTVQEYLGLPWWRKAAYRIMRNPLILLTVGSFGVFVFSHRFWGPKAGKRERSSVLWTNLALAILIGGAIWLVGWKAYLLMQIPVLFLGTSAGVWLFYVQHQFEGVYWERHEKWDFFKACMQGCSYYKLPAVLQWFTGNIGYHHIHHLSPRIPNYKLEQCYRDNPALQIQPLTLLASLKSLRLRIYDESIRQLTGWNILNRRSTASG
jgi:omega-6 fatty acid desaturase (delta-12 desaturase)